MRIKLLPPGVIPWGPPLDLETAPAGFRRCWQCRTLFAISAEGSPRYCARSCRNAYFLAQSARLGCCLRCRWRHGHGPNCRTGIAERDGWTCQLCGTPVDPRLPLDHPLSQSFDHILVQVHGGRRAEANLRLTHRACNNLRDAPEPGQLELPAAAYLALTQKYRMAYDANVGVSAIVAPVRLDE